MARTYLVHIGFRSRVLRPVLSVCMIQEINVLLHPYDVRIRLWDRMIFQRRIQDGPSKLDQQQRPFSHHVAHLMK